MVGARCPAWFVAGRYLVWSDIPNNRAVDAVITDMVRPNGIALSPDEKYLYVAATGATYKESGSRHIRRFTVDANGARPSGGEIFAESTAGLSDGFRVDRNGRIGTRTANGVHCYDFDGSPAKSSFPKWSRT